MKEIKINKEAFRFALSNFGKGTIFEEFANSFLCFVFGDEFIPVGGTKDKGIDGSLRLYNRKTQPTLIYQISTESDDEEKIVDSISKLLKNDVKVDKFNYVTSRKINNKDKKEDQFLLDYEIPMTIYDVEWFTSHVVNHQELALLYETFIESNVHEFQKPDKNYVVGNFITDPRLYVFLRQQFDSESSTIEIENKLADSLILYSLEGTGSETQKFKSNSKIKDKVAEFIKFNPKALNITIDKRLTKLSTKPRKINYHVKEDAYCLPYSTRLELKERDILETEIFSSFREQTISQLKNYLKDEGIKATRLLELIEATIHKIYHQQGVEFSTFIIEGQSRDIMELALPDIVGEVVDDSHISAKNKNRVKKALLMTIRNIAYNGTVEQKEYLRRLSYTYNMMFMLRWDPQLATSFQKIASQLKIYVGTSILIPALSEIFLTNNKRRYWNLLEGAHMAGVQLTINKTILDELVNHFHMIKQKYRNQYEKVEAYYLDNEMNTLYIDEIMIRAYFYSKMRNEVDKFNEFIEEFANPNLINAHRDLRSFLKDEFQIKFEDTEGIEKSLDPKDVQALTKKLSEKKQSKDKALTDAKLMLMVYKIREINDEESGGNVFGYTTWWLSKDIHTYNAVRSVFKNRFTVNCYMRSDFLFNYIALAPKRKEIDNMFKQIFPSMLGINLSYHMPKEICAHINKSLNEHSDKSPTRIKRAVRNYTEKLMVKTDQSTKKLSSYFDEELKKALSTNKKY